MSKQSEHPATPRIPTPLTDHLADRFGDVDPDSPYWAALQLATDLERKIEHTALQMSQPARADRQGFSSAVAVSDTPSAIAESEVFEMARKYVALDKTLLSGEEILRMAKLLVQCEAVLKLRLAGDDLRTRSQSLPIDVPLAIPPDEKKRVGEAIAAEMQKRWECDDDVIDSFGRVAAVAYVLGMRPRSAASSTEEPVAWLVESIQGWRSVLWPNEKRAVEEYSASPGHKVTPLFAASAIAPIEERFRKWKSGDDILAGVTNETGKLWVAFKAGAESNG